MPRFLLLTALLLVAGVALPGCDLFGGGDGDSDFFTQPSNSELSDLEDVFDGVIGCSDIATLDDDGSESGELNNSDCTLGDGSFVDLYAFKITETAQVEITQRSDDFDAYLVLVDDEGTEITNNDDGGGDTDAQISRTMSPGVYVIAANSLESGETGDYTLRVTGETDGDDN